MSEQDKPEDDDAATPKAGDATEQVDATAGASDAAAASDDKPTASDSEAADSDLAESKVADDTRTADSDAADPADSEAANNTTDNDVPARRMSARTTRRLLAAVAVVAVVVAFVTIFATGGFDRGDDAVSTGAGATGAAAGEAFGTAAAGTCLTWTKSDASDLHQVDCDDEHLFEVAATVDLSQYPGSEFGPDSKFPGVLRFTELKDEHCTPAVQQVLDSKFDPKGKFSVGLINPGEAGWSAGERTLRCGLQYSGNSGALRPIVGTVASQDQSDVLEPGTCVGINQNLPGDPVDCGQEHAFEVVSIVDLSTQFPGGPPSVADQDKFLEPECTRAATEYLGSPDALRAKTLTLFWGQIDSTSWLAGSRKVNCSIGKGADVGFAPIVGSAKGDITINGQAPVPPPDVPEGRSLPGPLPGASPPG